MPKASSPTPSPPRWLQRVFGWFCPEQLQEELLGDLLETYADDRSRMPATRANLRFAWLVLRFFRPGILRRNTTTYANTTTFTMLRAYFIIALRNFRKHLGYSMLNLTGLAVGMAACLIILQYVNHERSYDDFWPAADRTYRLQYDQYSNGELLFESATSYPAIAPQLMEEVDEVEAATRLLDANGTFQYEDVSFREMHMYYVDSLFLDVFELNFIKGNPEQALRRSMTILLSQSMAERYFGTQDPIGKTIKLDGLHSLEVSGVYQDLPNSHLMMDGLVSMLSLYEMFGIDPAEEDPLATSWDWYDFYNYFRAKPGVDPAYLQERIDAFAAAHTTEGPNAEYFKNNNRRLDLKLQPLQSIHLYSNINQEAEVNGNGRLVEFLSIIAGFILLIALINFINLSTARALERAQEVGVRKAIGAFRSQLIGQFMTEALLTMGLGAGLAVALALTFTPLYQLFTGTVVTTSLFGAAYFWPAAVGIFLLGWLAAGFYPALVLSGFKPVAVLSGKLDRSGKGVWLRKGLTVFQFAISLLLMVSTFTVFSQLRFMQRADLGIDLDNTLVVRSPTTVNDSTMNASFAAMRPQLAGLASVTHVSTSNYVNGDEIYWTRGGSFLLTNPDATTTIYYTRIDEDFVDAFGLHLVAGTNFSSNPEANQRKVIINETLARTFGASPDEIIGQKIRSGDTLEVIGVLADFYHMGLQKATEPRGFQYGTANRYICVKYAGDNPALLVEQVNGIFAQQFPNDPFEHFFLEDFFAQQYNTERNFSRSAALFSGLAIFIACLGLFGLTAFQAQKRTKEIGIRKVLGASVLSLLRLLTREVVILIGIAAVPALALGYYLMNDWLQGFAQRISISWWMLVLPSLSIVLIALLTVSYQTLRAARANPVEALRYE